MDVQWNIVKLNDEELLVNLPDVYERVIVTRGDSTWIDILGVYDCDEEGNSLYYWDCTGDIAPGDAWMPIPKFKVG